MDGRNFVVVPGNFQKVVYTSGALNNWITSLVKVQEVFIQLSVKTKQRQTTTFRSLWKESFIFDMAVYHYESTHKIWCNIYLQIKFNVHSYGVIFFTSTKLVSWMVSPSCNYIKKIPPCLDVIISQKIEISFLEDVMIFSPDVAYNTKFTSISCIIVFRISQHGQWDHEFTHWNHQNDSRLKSVLQIIGHYSVLCDS